MRFLLLLTLACCLALALPAHAATDPFAEFRIPEHSWQSGSAALGLFAARDHQGVPGANRRASALASLLQGRFSRGWDSDALQYGYGLALDGRVQTDHSHTRYVYEGFAFTDDQDEVDRYAAEYWRLDGSLRAYPLRVPLGLGGSIRAEGDYAQSYERAEQSAIQTAPLALRLDSRAASAGHEYRTQLYADLSVGLGRVRDASVVHSVHVLEERLRETGALSRPLSAQARERLAALYYVAPDYAQAHERTARYIWRDIERILSEDGALRGDGLDAYSVLRAAEPTSPSGRPMRLRGWFVGAVGGVTTTHAISRVEQQSAQRFYQDDVLLDSELLESSQRSVSSSDQVLLGGLAEYHLPVGWRWQFDATTRLTCPVRAGERGLDLTTGAAASWYVFDRWAANLSLQQARYYFAPEGSGGTLAADQWVTQVSAGVAYFIEDRTSLSLTLAEQQRRSTGDILSGGRPFQRSSRLNFGITYRFLGQLDVPGIIEPLRMMR